MPRYRVLRGKYLEGRHPVPPGSEEGARGAAKVYGKNAPDGDVVETNKDLSRYNMIGAPKFERLDDAPQAATAYVAPAPTPAPAKAAAPTPVPVPAAAPKPDEKLNLQLSTELQKMTVKELEAYAQEEEIDLKGANTKDAIIRTILATTKAASK